MGTEKKAAAVLLLAMLAMAALPEMARADHFWIFPCWPQFIKDWTWPPEGSWKRFFWHVLLGQVGLCAKDCLDKAHPKSFWDGWDTWDMCNYHCNYNILGPGRPPDTPCPNPFYHGRPHGPSPP